MRFIPAQDEYGRWAVQDTAQRFVYLFIQRYADEDSAQSMCDILNCEAGGYTKDKLWALHEKIRKWAAPLTGRVDR